MTLKLLACIALLLHVQLPSAPATAPESAAATSADSSELPPRLQQIDLQAQKLRDVTARFRQLKHTALLKKAMQSEGTVQILVDGGKATMRWDTTKPHPVMMLTNDTELKIYFPAEQLMEIYAMESGLAQLAASPLPRLEIARKYFTIEECRWDVPGTAVNEQRIALRLTPIDERVREHVVEVRLLIDLETACVLNAIVQYPDSERLELSFSDIRINTGVDARDLELNVGSDVRISRPLQPGSEIDS